MRVKNYPYAFGICGSGKGSLNRGRSRRSRCHPRKRWCAPSSSVSTFQASINVKHGRFKQYTVHIIHLPTRHRSASTTERAGTPQNTASLSLSRNTRGASRQSPLSHPAATELAGTAASIEAITMRRYAVLAALVAALALSAAAPAQAARPLLGGLLAAGRALKQYGNPFERWDGVDDGARGYGSAYSAIVSRCDEQSRFLRPLSRVGEGGGGRWGSAVTDRLLVAADASRHSAPRFRTSPQTATTLPPFPVHPRTRRARRRSPASTTPAAPTRTATTATRPPPATLARRTPRAATSRCSAAPWPSRSPTTCSSASRRASSASTR